MCMAMAERKARPQQGWSALTHAQRESPSPQGPLLPSFSRELPAPDPSEFTPLSLHPHSPNPSLIPSFAGVVKQQITANDSPLHMGLANKAPSASLGCRRGRTRSGCEEIEPTGPLLDPHTLAVSHLHARHSWADITLISDILQALDLDEDSTSAYLVSMSTDNTERVSASNDAAHPSSSQGSGDDSEVGELACATEEISPGVDTEQRGLGLDTECRDFLSSVKSVPIEPEWEEDEIYLSSRKDALRMSRASGKHACGAYKAFMGGDYSKAKVLSKQAREEHIEAEKLHAEAAKLILQARNGESPRNVWHLDLHGLHVNEAVAALQQRLQEIETRFLNPQSVEDVSTSQCSTEKSRLFRGSVLHGLPSNQELHVITGVGNHSRGGGSLPMAIKSFLIQNRYKFEESKPGVVVVRPKFQFLKDKGIYPPMANLGQ